jgi:hypothetical protein
MAAQPGSWCKQNLRTKPHVKYALMNGVKIAGWQELEMKNTTRTKEEQEFIDKTIQYLEKRKREKHAETEQKRT